jgi:hypothetical protein
MTQLDANATAMSFFFPWDESIVRVFVDDDDDDDLTRKIGGAFRS